MVVCIAVALCVILAMLAEYSQCNADDMAMQVNRLVKKKRRHGYWDFYP